MKHPTGVALDSADNVYVASQDKLWKFSRNGHFIVGQYGEEDWEFSFPGGMRFHHDHVYVCDRFNNHVQVFDTDLKFIRAIGSPELCKGKVYGWFCLCINRVQVFNHIHDMV